MTRSSGIYLTGSSVTYDWLEAWEMTESNVTYVWPELWRINRKQCDFWLTGSVKDWLEAVLPMTDLKCEEWMDGSSVTFG